MLGNCMNSPEAIIAICWVGAIAEMSRPMPSEAMTNTAESSSTSAGLPRSGTWKVSTPTKITSMHVEKGDDACRG